MARRYKKTAWTAALAAGLIAVPWPVVRAQAPDPGDGKEVAESAAVPTQDGEVPAADAPAAEDVRTSSERGRVRWLADIVRERFGISLVPDAAQRVLALETPSGQIVPLLEDVRGRAFRRDERLRERDVELVLRRYAGFPMAQVVKVFAWEEDGKYQVDYWCDVCAIVMYESGPCDCCQQPNELRLRRVDL